MLQIPYWTVSVTPIFILREIRSLFSIFINIDYFNTPLSQCFIDDVTISLKGLECKLVVISDYIQTCLETVCMLIKCCAILCIQLL